MTNNTALTLFCKLIFTLFNPENSSAATIICWDGIFVVDLGHCDHKPDQQTFTMLGVSTEGTNVSAYVVDDEVRLLEFTSYGEMGWVDYSITNSIIDIRKTSYNMPFYMNGFDPQQSKLSSIEQFRLRKTESANIVVSGDALELSDKRASGLACMLNAIYRHVNQSEGSPTTLEVNCN